MCLSFKQQKKAITKLNNNLLLSIFFLQALSILQSSWIISYYFYSVFEIQTLLSKQKNQNSLALLCRKIHYTLKVHVLAVPIDKPHPQFISSNLKKNWGNKLRSSNEAVLEDKQGQTSVVSKPWHAVVVTSFRINKVFK